MDFEIDFPRVQRITSEELAQARDEIAALGPVQALRRSLQRHEARLAAAPDAATLACRAGCAWCCHFSVDVRAVEVFSILEFVEQTFTASERERVWKEINANAALLHSLSDLERVQRNIKCAFLVDSRCSIYAVRPQTCRNYHATDVVGCQQSFDEPGNLDIDPDFAPLVYQVGGAHVEAFAKAMSEASYDVKAYELNAAFSQTLRRPAQAEARFNAKQHPFSELDGMDVPSEWLGEDE
jgi:Fe-S-cluster containining protein